MRIALISLLAPADDDPRTPLGHLTLAGKSIATRQLELALKLGCERIICVAAGLGRPELALQHRAEAAGVKFNLVSGPRPLLGLVSSADELFGFADGVLPVAEEVMSALSGGKGVLVLPVEAGVAAGFERIDLNHAWAGIFAIPGQLIERLSELPMDCDAVSALLRIALQGRVPEKPLPEALLTEGRWILIQSRAQLAELEPDWFRRHAAGITPYAPGRSLARIVIGRLAGFLLGRGVRPALFTVLGVGIASIGVAGAWLGQHTAALVACGIGWWLTECGSALTAIAREESADAGPGERSVLAAVPVTDLFLASALLGALAGNPLDSLAKAALLLGLLWLSARLLVQDWSKLLQDRAILAGLLALSAAYGVLEPSLDAISVLLLAALLGFAGRGTRLTQV